MKRFAVFTVIYIVGLASGMTLQYLTTGAKERSRVAAVEQELKAKSDKLEKCTDVLIEKLHAQP